MQEILIYQIFFKNTFCCCLWWKYLFHVVDLDLYVHIVHYGKRWGQHYNIFVFIGRLVVYTFQYLGKISITKGGAIETDVHLK